MTDEMHPQVAAVLKQAQRLQSLVDDQLHKMSSESFTATDETETVEVTLNGHHYLTGAFISDGLLRLGARTVEQRINEALQNATARLWNPPIRQTFQPPIISGPRKDGLAGHTGIHTFGSA